MTFIVFIGLTTKHPYAFTTSLNFELLNVRETFNEVGDISSSIWKRIQVLLASSILRSSVKKAAIIIVVSLAVIFSIVTQRSSKWKPIKTLHLTKESFQNKNTSAQSRLGEHGPLNYTTDVTLGSTNQTIKAAANYSCTLYSCTFLY